MNPLLLNESCQDNLMLIAIYNDTLLQFPSFIAKYTVIRSIYRLDFEDNFINHS